MANILHLQRASVMGRPLWQDLFSLPNGFREKKPHPIDKSDLD